MIEEANRRQEVNSVTPTKSDSKFLTTSIPQHELGSHYNCTCREPPTVVLQDDSQNKTAFIENLRTHGWSPIVVPKAPLPAPSQEEVLAIFGRRRQRPTSNETSDVAFIASESGSSEGTIEPKESLEVLLSKCADLNGEKVENQKQEDCDEITVKAWCKTMSWIAHTIRRDMLNLPENTFLPEDPKESLDLLRVFHYYAVSDKPTLGSSEHTDWGSLTVVWQDSVGGLQTFCRKRQKWINVKPAVDDTTTKSHRWECIVHVGDMSSLVLDQSSRNNIDNSKDSISYPWPSPRHRVKSHPEKERVSLVYFGYPPRGLSLCDIQKRIDEGWAHSANRGKKLPLAEYFLLRNQSSGASVKELDVEADRLYKTMWNLPVQDIVHLKWEQVSR
mmetsp:Transcript_597/g.1413  ORF Transcript_597/g.1413 Transcript_597/m.1413 type:complete len:388 (-) Transcript_597:170-1333(-)